MQACAVAGGVEPLSRGFIRYCTGPFGASRHRPGSLVEWMKPDKDGGGGLWERDLEPVEAACTCSPAHWQRQMGAASPRHMTACPAGLAQRREQTVEWAWAEERAEVLGE